MALDFHTVSRPTGSSPTAQSDRVIVANQTAVANAAGSGAGASVVTAVSFTGLPASYSVFVQPASQDVNAFVTAKTNTGFTVTLVPNVATYTIVAGTFDVLVVA